MSPRYGRPAARNGSIDISFSCPRHILSPAFALFAKDASICTSDIFAFYKKLAERQPYAALVALSITVVAMAFWGHSRLSLTNLHSPVLSIGVENGIFLFSNLR